MATKKSPLAAAFLWAVWAGAVYSGYDFLIDKDYGQAARDVSIAMPVAAAVAYVERKHKNDSGKAAVTPAAFEAR